MSSQGAYVCMCMNMDPIYICMSIELRYLCVYTYSNMLCQAKVLMCACV